jgi:RNA polymerase sigma-70 factor (ECF subfamily)
MHGTLHSDIGLTVRPRGPPVEAAGIEGTPRRRWFEGLHDVPTVEGDVAFSELVARVAARQDRAAFAALFRHFAPRIKSYLVHQGATAAVAEEIAQETMLAVWRKAESFDQRRGDAAAWIFTIARNMRIDAFRRERHPEVDPEDPLLVGDAPPGADDRLDVERRSRRLRQALESLPAEQVRLLRLSFFEDKAHREIERDLGVPLGTVKSRLRRAMLHLRSLLGEEA